MKEKPILFSGPMVREILYERKKQTRRLNGLSKINEFPHYFLGLKNIDGILFAEFRPIISTESYLIKCHWQIEDILWVRETWGIHKNFESSFKKGEKIEKSLILYRSDEIICTIEKWRPSIFMPRWASRITLKVTDIRVQRLQDISEEDAKAEGVKKLFTEEEIRDRPEFPADGGGYRNYMWHGFGDVTDKMIKSWPYQYSDYKTAKESFYSLWEKINGTGSYESNPWVWAISFERIK